MGDPELLEQLKTASVDERINLIEVILQSLKRDIHSPPRQTIAETRPLRGKVRYYEDPYEPVAVENWEAKRLL
ncbi:MAG: hypothetical protein FWK01_29105 [Pantanalinema sp. GBBB05]|nr:hypothetical protein [Pantanalinema sp. GBBB05]